MELKLSGQDISDIECYLCGNLFETFFCDFIDILFIMNKTLIK